jgi:hypothetical protein
MCDDLAELLASVPDRRPRAGRRSRRSQFGGEAIVRRSGEIAIIEREEILAVTGLVAASLVDGGPPDAAEAWFNNRLFPPRGRVGSLAPFRRSPLS